MVGILSSFGLSAATGLNAYLPLLIVGLLARFTDLVTLRPPFDVLENSWVLLALVVLLLIEVTVDKIPAVDTANDVIQTVFRPAAGAILFAASTNAISNVSPALALICGLLVASGVHAAKATVRPVITATTMGVGNPVVSTVEDVASGTTTLVCILLPAMAAIIIAGLLILFAWWYFRRRRRRLARA
jgi:cytochrome bd-type quinol oxidase subunit 2